MSNSPEDWPLPILNQCPNNKWRDPRTNKCSTKLDNCPEGKWRNPLTNRCKNIKRLSPQERKIKKILEEREGEVRRNNARKEQNSDSDSDSDSDSEDGELDETVLRAEGFEDVPQITPSVRRNERVNHDNTENNRIHEQLSRIMANPILRTGRQKKKTISQVKCNDPPCARKENLFVDMKPEEFFTPKNNKQNLFVDQGKNKQNLFVDQGKNKQNLFVDQGKNKQNLFSTEAQLKECTEEISILNLRIAELLSENAELKSRTNKIEIEEAATKITSFIRKSIACKKVNNVRITKRTAKKNARLAVQAKRKERELKKLKKKKQKDLEKKKQKDLEKKKKKDLEKKKKKDLEKKAKKKIDKIKKDAENKIKKLVSQVP